MGASGKWIRTLVGLRPAAERERPDSSGSGKGRKWTRRWRSSSSQRGGGAGSNASASEAPSEALSTAEEFNSVGTAVERAPPRDFRVIRQEWATVCIQTAFRAFLARRALRGIVRLQALVRGRRVHNQLAVTLKFMNALVRVQERARDRRARVSADSRDSHNVPEVRRDRADPVKEAEAGWCDSQGTMDNLRAKIHKRHEGAVKRERAIAYARSHQRSSSHCGRPGSPAISLFLKSLLSLLGIRGLKQQSQLELFGWVDGNKTLGEPLYGANQY